MPRIDLPSGGWAEYRDRLMAQDKIAVWSAVKVTYQPDPADPRKEIRVSDGGNDERMRVALLSRIVTSWSFAGVPVPAQNIATAEDVIGSTLDLDDYEALTGAVEPLFQRILAKPGEKAGEKAGEAAPADEPAATP